MNKLVVILALYLTGSWSFLNQELDQYSSLHALQVPLQTLMSVILAKGPARALEEFKRNPDQFH